MTASPPHLYPGNESDALDRIWDIVHTPSKATNHRSAERHFMADFDAIRQVIKDFRTRHPAQTAQVPATQENIFDCLYANVYADNDGVAGISAFVEDLMERFDVRLKASAVSSTDCGGGK